MRLSVIGQIVRRHWWRLAALAAAGALVGAGASLLFSPGYESASSVLLQGSRGEDELLTEAQIAMSSIVLDRTAAALGWGITGTELRDSVRAGVVDGSVIEIRGTAETTDRAQQLTDQMVEEYVTFSTQLVSSPSSASAQVLEEQRESLRQQVARTNRLITELHGSARQDALTVESVRTHTQLESLRTALAEAVEKLDEAEAASSRVNMVVIGPAARPTSPAEPTLTTFVAGGALLFGLLGLFAHLVAARADRRPRSDSEIAAALGSPVVGSVDVPEEPPANTQQAGPTRRPLRPRRRARDDRHGEAPQLPVSGEDLGRNVRYRRVLARLRDAPEDPLLLLVLVADDDVTAHRAVAELAVAAGTDGGHRTELRVAHVSAARPTVPDHRGVSGALVVLTAGTRTAWELVGIAEACADAGHQVVGALVTHRARPIGDRPVDPMRVASYQVPVNGKATAGSA